MRFHEFISEESTINKIFDTVKMQTKLKSGVIFDYELIYGTYAWDAKYDESKNNDKRHRMTLKQTVTFADSPPLISEYHIFSNDELAGFVGFLKNNVTFLYSVDGDDNEVDYIDEVNMGDEYITEFEYSSTFGNGGFTNKMLFNSDKHHIILSQYMSYIWWKSPTSEIYLLEKAVVEALIEVLHKHSTLNWTNGVRGSVEGGTGYSPSEVKYTTISKS